jgi:hypothetical protein
MRIAKGAGMRGKIIHIVYIYVSILNMTYLKTCSYMIYIHIYGDRQRSRDER